MEFFKKDTTAKVLLIAYGIFFILLGLSPYDRTAWWAENLPIAGIVAALVIMYIKDIKFSPASYLFMAVLVFLHTIGGHYTFERVPFGFVTDLFGFERNHYDRMAHFSVGFYAYPIMEYLFAKKLTQSKALAFLFGVFAIAFVAMGYELVEWIYAASSDPSAGAAFLGSQGDIWDAQKDMLADTLGAIVSACAFLAVGRFKKSEALGSPVTA